MDVPEGLVIVMEHETFKHPQLSKMTCTNCVKIQECNKKHYRCSDFELYGRVGPKPNKSKGLCSGCRNDYYNYGEGKKRSMNSSGCFTYGNAAIELRSQPYNINQRPPWSLQWQLSCYRRRY